MPMMGITVTDLAVLATDPVAVPFTGVELLVMQDMTGLNLVAMEGITVVWRSCTEKHPSLNTQVIVEEVNLVSMKNMVVEWSHIGGALL